MSYADSSHPTIQLTTHELRETQLSRGKRRVDVSLRSATKAEAPRRHRERPARNPAWTHEGYFKSLKGQRVAVLLSGFDEAFTVKLIDTDRYTLLVEQSNGQQEVIFKSAIQVVSALPQVN